MALLEMALIYCLKNEGGFVNNPADRGGATNMGISTPTLSTYLGRPATVTDVKNLTLAQATDIYRKMYWGIIQGDKIKHQLIATLLMDMAILTGPFRAVSMAQGLVGAQKDGLMGPKTLALLNAYTPALFAQGLCQAAQDYFISIVVSDTTNTQKQFLPGWVYRSRKMLNTTLA